MASRTISILEFLEMCADDVTHLPQDQTAVLTSVASCPCEVPFMDNTK